MRKFELDAPIREVLHDCAADIHADDAMKTRIDAVLDRPRVRRFAHRRLVIGVAAAVCLTLVGALAGGPVAGLATGTRHEDERTSVALLREDAEAVLDGVAIPEDLGKFSFERGAIQYTDKLDESGGRFGTYPNASVTYRMGDVRLNLSARLWDSELDSGQARPHSVHEVQGTEVSYTADSYLFLPEGEQPTADEQARADAGALYISYGTDARESKVFQHIGFRCGDMVYSLYTFDAAVTEQILLDAAAEVLAAAA